MDQRNPPKLPCGSPWSADIRHHTRKPPDGQHLDAADVLNYALDLSAVRACRAGAQLAEGGAQTQSSQGKARQGTSLVCAP
mmetsp:Transcript_23919/g.59291  ORF Transcript_23919/g.59291 Transcript_23919/m.59291 type:complete len:81 (-) Transcript_23919:994-1236(-)